MLKCAPGTSRYEEYAAIVVNALHDMRDLSISDPAQDALPLCMVLNSRIEQTLFEGLSEICHRILPQCNQMFCGCEIASTSNAWREISKSKKSLTLKLLSFGALETCIDLALNTSQSTRVTESANNLIHNFIYFPDGISRFVSILEKESKNSATTTPGACTKQLLISCRYDRMIRLVDIVVTMYNSPHALESFIVHVRETQHPSRMMTLFRSLLAAASAMFTCEHHAVSRKVFFLLQTVCTQSCFWHQSFLHNTCILNMAAHNLLGFYPIPVPSVSPPSRSIKSEPPFRAALCFQ